MKATIVTIGDEILIGQILDTNTRYISQALNRIGIVVHQQISIGDTAQQITTTLDQALSTTDLTIITGGLGPTKDDITKHTLTAYFNSELVYNQEVGDFVSQLLARRGIAFTELNRGQAMVPKCCTVLHNAHGTAPGMMFERDGKIVISLPGVPFEMRHLIDDKVIPMLAERFTLKSIIHRTMITSGIPESLLAERIAAWEDALPEMLHLAYLPAPNIVRLRLSAYQVEGQSVGKIIDQQFELLRQIIPQAVVGFEDASVEQLLHNALIERGEKLSVAESCTGGNIASKFTAMAGASAYFMAGVVSYSNDAKSDILGVNPELIATYGAVSEQVAIAMAEGVKRVGKSDYGIATTGIAGPSGGSAEKPVGTVWFGISTPERTFAVMKNCGTDRGQIIERATAHAIRLLYDNL
ncbi:MAG: competence/damage-inducible protein A [Alistipes sp.]|nr:competence/damage-inducible protein A [Alistipes sp.]